MSDSAFLTACRLGKFLMMVDGRDIVMVDCRVAQLQSELLAEDLTPPPESENWSDHRLRRWFENGGGPNQQLSSFLQNALTSVPTALFDALHDGDIFDVDNLLAISDLGAITKNILSVGERTKLRLALSKERTARKERLAERERLEAEAADERAFRLRAAIHNSMEYETEDGQVDSSLDIPPLPNGLFVDAKGAGSQLGGRAWPCAAVLTRYLRSEAETRSNLANNASVIELGAGIGICGLYAAGLGARQLLLTDIIVDGSSGEANELDTALNENIARNRELLGLHSVVMGIAQLNFSEASEASACRSMSDGGEGFDVVLASDVTYAPIGVDFEHLITCIATVLKPNGVALVCHETRLGMQRGQLASDGGDPVVKRLRELAAAAQLDFRIVHDERPKHTFATSGMRCILEMRHRRA